MRTSRRTPEVLIVPLCRLWDLSDHFVLAQGSNAGARQHNARGARAQALAENGVNQIQRQLLLPELWYVCTSGWVMGGPDIVDNVWIIGVRLWSRDMGDDVCLYRVALPLVSSKNSVPSTTSLAQKEVCLCNEISRHGLPWTSPLPTLDTL